MSQSSSTSSSLSSRDADTNPIVPQVWNLIDDTDTRITYSGDSDSDWELHFGNAILEDFSGTLNGLSTDGDVFNNTVHRTSQNGTSFAFRFNGTSNIDIYASLTTTDPENINLGRVDITCVLDGNVVALNGISLTSGRISVNRAKICSARNVPSNKEHEVGFKIDSLVQARFGLDYIAYEPIPGVVAGGEDGGGGDTLLLWPNSLSGAKNSSQTDSEPIPHLSFDSGWKANLNGDKVVTKKPGSAATMRFNGTSIQLYGDLTGNSSTKSNSGTYELDNQLPVSFDLTNPDPFRSDQWTNQLFFNLSFLDPTVEHTLIVKHNGTGAKDEMPLMIGSFVVKEPTREELERARAGTTTTSESSSPTAPTSSGSDRTGSSSSNGAIIGGTVGGVVLLAIILACVFFWVKRRRDQGQQRKLFDYQDPEKDYIRRGGGLGMGTVQGSLIVTPFTDTSNGALEASDSPNTSMTASPINTITTNSYLNRSRDRKSSRNGADDSIPSSNPTTPGMIPNEEVDLLRLGNLKLQQRVEVLRHVQSNHNGLGNNSSDESQREDVPGAGPEEGVRVPRVHTDSGWRMEGQEDMEDVPPNYTER